MIYQFFVEFYAHCYSPFWSINDKRLHNLNYIPAFRRYVDGKYKGAFQLSIFEVIATGAYLYLKEGKDEIDLPNKLRSVSISLFSDPTFMRYSGSGSKANYRWPRLLPLARRFFLDENQE
ncbi:hypothetical protein [Endozoicomonas atrinae]|uniref:hypothetical protein n=1 Tax=Endozoicomonas atrinae TaxID=1333660 RepID=UPI003B00F306